MNICQASSGESQSFPAGTPVTCRISKISSRNPGESQRIPWKIQAPIHAASERFDPNTRKNPARILQESCKNPARIPDRNWNIIETGGQRRFTRKDRRLTWTLIGRMDNAATAGVCIPPLRRQRQHGRQITADISFNSTTNSAVNRNYIKKRKRRR